MKLKKIWILWLFVILCSSNVFASPVLKSIAVNGEVDLSSIDLLSDSGQMINLEGKWNFYWKRYINPSAFITRSQALADASYDFPSVWNNYNLDGIENYGYGTWHLRVSGLKSDSLYGLKAGCFYSAASIFVNGELIQAHGQPGTSRKTEKPAWHSLCSVIRSSKDGIIDIVIHASNYTDRQSGTYIPIVLGKPELIQKTKQDTLSRQLFIMGAIWVMGAYYLCLFSYRKNEHSAIWFACLCFILGFRILCYDEFYLVDIFPNIPFKLLFNLGYLTLTFGIGSFVGFYKSTFPDEFPKWAYVTSLSISIAISIFFIVSPCHIVASGLVYYQIFMLIVALFSIYTTILAVIRKRKGAIIFCCGLIVLSGAVFQDVLVSSGIISGVFITQFGMLAFLFALSIIQTKRFAEAFSISEKLTVNLSKMNKSLERFVPKEFLSFLHKDTIEDVNLGDSVSENMAIMFVDIRSYTTIAESLSPEDTFAFINTYLAHVGPSVRHFGGFIDKYLGDGFMALFPNGAESALTCALDIEREVLSFNKEREAQNKMPIRIGIGLHVGSLMLGTIGETMRMDGSVISDAVNLSSRLESVAKQYHINIAISETVVAGLPDPTQYGMRFIGKLKVKGKTEPVSVFEIYDGDEDDLREKKDSIRAYYERAVQCHMDRNFIEANKYFNKVLEILPNDGPSIKYIESIKMHMK